jgi:WD40 repeat protein
MDFLYPRRERRNRIALFVSYGLVACAIGIASVILLYQTDGYCVDKAGAVDRCGFVFVSSRPDGATIEINGKRNKAQTNTKLNLRSGDYTFRLSKTGYRSWERTIAVAGGDVQRFDYPLLVPNTLSTAVVQQHAGGLRLATQSPDRRWLLMADDKSAEVFHLYDLRKPDQPQVSNLTLPLTVVTAGEGQHQWEVVEWSSDNRHVLLAHRYAQTGAVVREYVVVDRQSAAASRNISKDLALAPTDEPRFFDKKADTFYVYNTESKILRTAGLDGTPLTNTQLLHVLAYKSYGDDTLLYVTDTLQAEKPTANTVGFVLRQGTRSVVVRKVAASSTPTNYLLDIARYDGRWYVVLGTSSDKGIYVYNNPVDQPLENSKDLPRPERFVRVIAPTSVSFSANAQFIAAQGGGNVGLYDVENKSVYQYALPQPLEAPQLKATWMDGHRLQYVSGGTLQVFDYDKQNQQALVATLPSYGAFFSTDYQYVYGVQTTAAGYSVTTTPLVLQ